MIQTYCLSDDGRHVVVGIAPEDARAKFFMRFSSRRFGSEKLCGIISTLFDLAATHPEPARKQ